MIFKKIISLFTIEKINIVCHNKDEWVSTQLELFKKGYYWESSGKTIATCMWKYPIVLKNYRNGDKFGSKILIMDEYDFMIKTGKDGNTKFTNSVSYIRQQKIKKIKWQ